MEKKKTIKIDRRIPKAIFIGFLLGWITVFIVEHYGEISYIADTSELIAKEKRRKQQSQQQYNELLQKKLSGEQLSILEESTFKVMRSKQAEENNFSFNVEIPNDTPVSSIFLDTPFGSNIGISGKSYFVRDVSSSYGKFHEYSNKFGHYLNATLEDFKYVLGFGLVYTIVLFIFLYFRIRLA
ncbi:hypothetical protein F8C76_11290 [Flagellimonas olearia]|uniref:Uncharacterized protein n=1 Tax=Flagellimonas olearia TaxID=552546 RepID=A0A6I1DUE3_9FLAO|nr:hypothetical protein [Allomuricauda olearia]KAB7528440.1 hypothetical protein F8C76_11290 [Allomuricauda olearia]